ncbi:MAG: 50S ribosomal protein L2, partial [Bacillota bacterium]|nr:50S ribosomal protein L2 [Bacillota bacterium]
MGIKSFKPTSPAVRQMTVSTFEEITKKAPEKSLVVALKKNSG